MREDYKQTCFDPTSGFAATVAALGMTILWSCQEAHAAW